jgi:phosphatidylinositol glycan class B
MLRRRKDVGASHSEARTNSLKYTASPLNIVIKLKYLFLAVLVIRLFNAFTIRTFFQPDEYYQVLEPAHNFVYGYGYMTWEWKQRLRSSIGPMIYAIGYEISKLLGGNVHLVLVIPKIISAIIASIGEVMFYKFVVIYTGDTQLALIALVLSILNPFNWYIYTRSFSNCLETMLTICAFRYWPWNHIVDGQFYTSLVFAYISCIVRPTNGLIWITLGINLLIHTKTSKIKLIVHCIVEFVVLLLINGGLDYWFYQQLTFPLYNFFEFNYIKNLSIFYGTAPWHFYLFQAVPLFLMTYLPFFLRSIYLNHTDILVYTCMFVIFGFSTVSHKEFRFIFPLMPIFLLFTAKPIQELYRKKSMKSILIAIVLINISIGYFFTRINEKGAIDVIEYLRDEPTVESFGFLTPCHSTPWQSYLHNPKFESSWALTCEPPLHLSSGNLQSMKQYQDESDIFFSDEARFLNANFPPFDSNKLTKYKWPTHLIIFQPLEDVMDEYLKTSPYRKCKRFFNSYLHWDSRRTGDIIVYCKQ